jgi:glycosyltransferase involved in cell wall biosynthesis
MEQMVIASDLGVTASVPYFGALPYVRRAVESLLQQTHRNLTVVVVCDGDPNPPWPELSHIRDPRLVRFSLQGSRGPYFAHQVVLGASSTPYFLVQDADDWSSPERVAILLSKLIADGSDLAFSAWQQYREDSSGALKKDSIRWRRRNPAAAPFKGSAAQEPFLFDPVLTGEFINRASHHGVFRKQALERIGGYYGGFRMNYDTLLTNLLLIVGKVSFVDAPLYHYLHRCDSLSHSRATGARSAERNLTREKQAALYREALQLRRSWVDRQISSVELTARIAQLVTRSVPVEARNALARETSRLAGILRNTRM